MELQLAQIKDGNLNLSYEKNPVPYFPWNPGCLIGVPIMIEPGSIP